MFGNHGPPPFRGWQKSQITQSLTEEMGVRYT